MIAPSLYRLCPISHTLYRIPYNCIPKKILQKCSKFKKFQILKKILNLHKISKIQNFHKIHVFSKTWLKYMI